MRSAGCVVALAALAACSPPPMSDAGDATGGDATADITMQGDAPRDDGATPGMDAPADTVVTDTPGADARDAGSDTIADGDDGSSDGGDGGCALRRVVVTTSDFTTGGYAIGALAPDAGAPLHVVAPPAGDAGVRPEQDHVVRTSGCVAFDLWRTFAARINTLVVLDPDNLYVPRRSIPLEIVPAMGDGGTPQAADPYDIAVLNPTRAYVTQYNSPNVMAVDPTMNGAAARRGIVSLAPFADADGIPEASSLAIVGTTLYVAVQQLDRSMGFPWRLPAHSQVVVIDTTMGSLGVPVDLDATAPGVQGIQLSAANPQARLALSPDGHYLLVSSAGDFSSNTDGALDVIDTRTNRVAHTITPAMLGGDPGSVVAVTANTAWVAVDRPVGDASVVHTLVAFDYTTGAVTSTPIAQSPTIAYGELRRAPDGTIWAIDTGFSMTGSVLAFTPGGSPAMMPFTTPGTNTYSLDFVP